MQQERLFVGALVVLNLHAVCIAGEGWSLTVTSRRDGESWQYREPQHYDRLSTSELADVIAMVAATQLGTT